MPREDIGDAVNMKDFGMFIVKQLLGLVQLQFLLAMDVFMSIKLKYG